MDSKVKCGKAPNEAVSDAARVRSTAGLETRRPGFVEIAAEGTEEYNKALTLLAHSVLVPFDPKDLCELRKLQKKYFS